MDLSDIEANAYDQNRGRWFDLLDPVTGATTGMALLIAGPDSRVQAEAAAQMVDDLANVADADGRVSGSDRVKVRRALLARCILDWRMTEDAQPVPLTHKTALRLLSAAAWVTAQVDSFAGNRRVFMSENEL